MTYEISDALTHAPPAPPTSPAAEERLTAIRAFVRRRLKKAAKRRHHNNGAAADLRWQHSLRVSRYGQIIAEAEGANVHLTTVACLLHDIARFDPGATQDHGRRGARIARKHLQRWGYAPHEIEAVCYAIAAHVDEPQPETLLAQIVADADDIDRFGPYRTLTRWGRRALDDYAAAIEAAQAHLQMCRSYQQTPTMHTPTGQRLFDAQVAWRIDFFTALIAEHQAIHPQAK